MSKEKNIKDYLHLYLGCEVDTNIQGQYVHPYGNVSLEKLTAENLFRILDTLDRDVKNKETWDEDSDHYCKPLLRPLSDMTEEEREEFKNLCGLEKEDLDCLTEFNDRFFDGQGSSFGTAHLTNILQWAVGVKYLLSKRFDLFGLIDAGNAIDKTKTP